LDSNNEEKEKATEIEKRLNSLNEKLTPTNLVRSNVDTLVNKQRSKYSMLYQIFLLFAFIVFNIKVMID